MEQRRIVRVLEAVASQPTGTLPDRLCNGAAGVLNATGVGISLEAGERILQTIGATTAGQVGEQLQSDLGEGPAYTAHQYGLPVLTADLEHDGTWPAFGPAATAAGLRATFAFPLRSGAVRLGALSLYRRQAGDIGHDHHADALVVAQLALDVVLAMQSGRTGDELDQLLTTYAATTAEIHQASGIVSVQLGVPVGAALALLRARAYAEERPLGSLAHDVVAHRRRLDHDG